MKKALRQKFKGMKVSLPSPEVKSQEKNSEPDDIVNQNITVIITDQDQMEASAVKDTSNLIVEQIESDLCSNTNCRIEKATTTSSQTKSITKSSSGQNKDIPAVMKLGLPITSNASTDQQVVKVNSDLSSQSKIQPTSTSSVSRNISQSRLNDLVALVKSRSNSGCNLGQDYLTTSGEHPATNAIPKPAFYGKSDMNCPSLCLPKEGQFPHSSTHNLNSIAQARLPSPLVPFLYHPYTYPIQVSTGYQSCLTGYTANSLIPWTPLTYFQGYTANPHYSHGPTLDLARSSSTSAMDATLDLSVEKNSSSQNQTRHIDFSKNVLENDLKHSKKRSASVSSIPVGNEIHYPKSKIRKLSADTPLYSSTNYLPGKSEKAKKSQIMPTASDNTATYLCLKEDRESREGKPNSIKALQELTLKINGNLGVKSTQGQCVSTSKKSLSSGTLTATLKHALFSPKQKVNESKSKGDFNVSKGLPNKALFKQNAVPGSQNSALSAHSLSSTTRHLTEAVHTSNIKQYHHTLSMPSVEREQNQVISCPQKQVYSVRDQSFEQLHGEPKVSQFTYHMGVAASLDTKSTETESSIITSGTNKKGQACMRSFPYSQHIQLPDGNVSLVDFPALISHSSKNTPKSSDYNNKTNVEDKSICNFKSDIRTEVSKTSLLSERPGANLTSEISTDGPNRYSLYLTRSDMSSKTEETRQPKSSSPLNKGLENIEINSSKGKETCLIIETTSENGTEQVQFKLDKKRSANLLGELMKFKPHTDQDKKDSGSREGLISRSMSNNNDAKYFQQMSELNSDDVYSQPVSGTGNIGTMDQEKSSMNIGSKGSWNKETSCLYLSIEGNETKEKSGMYLNSDRCVAKQKSGMYLGSDESQTKEMNVVSEESKTKEKSGMYLGSGGSQNKDKSGLYLGSETGSSFSSLNVSPYLFGMLPDTTTLIDEKTDDINDDDFADCDEDEDDVFLHPIF